MESEGLNISYSTVIDDTASLQNFYSLTNQLSRNKKVRFTGKLDEADCIEWNFKYRGYPLSLHYNIYTGITLYPSAKGKTAIVNEVAVFLKKKNF